MTPVFISQSRMIWPGLLVISGEGDGWRGDVTLIVRPVRNAFDQSNRQSKPVTPRCRDIRELMQHDR